MTTRFAAVPERFQCLVRQDPGHACGAQKLGLPACLSATIELIEFPRASLRPARLFHRFMHTKPTKPTDSVTTLPAATNTFDYERTLQACAAGDRSAFQTLYKQEARLLLGAWAAEGVEAKIGPSDGQVFDDFAAQYLDIWQEIGEK